MRTRTGLAAAVLSAVLAMLTPFSAAQTAAPHPGAAAAGGGLPTTADLHALADAGQYREALKGLFRVLELKGPAAAGYDRYELLMLRGECQLQIREQPSALDSYAAAQKEATANSKPEPAAKAGAMELLLQRSSGFTYTPRTGDSKEPISILDPARRPRALLCLYADEMATVSAKFKLALAAKSLPPIMEFAKTAATIRGLELATNGNNEKTTAMFADLGKHAAELMNAAVEVMATQVETISALANKLVSEDYNYVDPSGKVYLMSRICRQGLGGSDVQNLKGDFDTCSKFRPAAGELSAALGSEAATFDAAVKKATETASKARDLLNTDFTIPVR